MIRRLIPGLLALTVCSLAGSGDLRTLEFRAAAIQDDDAGPGPTDVPMMPRDCLTPPLSGDTAFLLPSGRRVSLVLGAGPRHEVRLTPTDVSVTEEPSAVDVGASSFFATPAVSERTFKRAAEFRQRFSHCRLAILLDGEIVGIDDPEAIWVDGLPGGQYPSRHALAVKYPPMDGWRHKENEKRDISRRKAFWDWRSRRDFWELYCDPSLLGRVRSESPELYQEVMRRSAEIDCREPPPKEPGLE